MVQRSLEGRSQRDRRRAGLPEPDELRIAALGTRLHVWLGRFDDLLDGRGFLLSETLGILNVCAFPFLKYARIAPLPGEEERFHHVLHNHQRVAAASLTRLHEWIERVDALPRA